jgi:hypothetical protein
MDTAEDRLLEQWAAGEPEKLKSKPWLVWVAIAAALATLGLVGVGLISRADPIGPAIVPNADPVLVAAPPATPREEPVEVAPLPPRARAKPAALADPFDSRL